MRHVRAGAYCWVGLTAYVLSADSWLIRTGQATMSEVFGDAILHPRRRWPVIGLWAIITAHLFGNYFPTRLRVLDPIGPIARMIANTPRGERANVVQEALDNMAAG